MKLKEGRICAGKIYSTLTLGGNWEQPNAPPPKKRKKKKKGRIKGERQSTL